MKYAATDEIIAIRLSEGEDLADSLAHVCKACDVDSAVIVSAAGMVSSVTFGWYNGRDYNTESVREIMELTSLSGNVSFRGGSLYPHLHGVFNEPDHAALSGHLLQAIVFNNAELFLKPLATVHLGRSFDGSFEALSPEKKM
ncbi:MAG TPA: DNA-binding protein [Aminobacteriaceae bacterium]|nr:DNA-binding protein [Aminobacteriaceae bacterium]